MADIGSASIGIGQTVGVFLAFLPGLDKVRKESKDSDTAKDVRNGEVMAIVVSVGVGAVISSLTKSPTPLYASVAVALLLVVVYEYTLRQNETKPAEVTAP